MKPVYKAIILFIFAQLVMSNLAGAQATSATTTTIYYYIFNPSGTAISGNFVGNSSTFQGLLGFENTGLCYSLGLGLTNCGILGLGLMLVIFLVILLTISFVADFMIGVIVAAFICDVVGLLFMELGILLPNFYYIFVGITVGSVILFLVRGSLRPY